ncbi:hypothetical protein B0A48_09152 [Cryoendolithus antarcticus]|uniref:Transcriptional adapter 2 n=1 Tax=Cryoendolithus antarcticus TaxID=1507870 RepID=A0A1V8T256_9PEZI|nr:hypothetical protein B0A48_09152 [Cryoendolithus antarcticus]
MGLITKAKGAPREGGGSGGGVKYICNICSNDITSTVRIRCYEKQCSDYDLCVPCFSAGRSNLHHDPRTHRFQVVEPHSIPIFDESWGADEELLLLEGLEQYGLGSWADVADHIGGYREKDEVRDHYIETYVNSTRFPLAVRADPSDTTLSDSIPRDEFQARKKRRIEERKDAIAAETVAPTPAKPSSASVPSCHEVAGFMPGRLEFETEYFNEAEEAVQHMQFSPDEGTNPLTGTMDPETDLKMVVMSIYNDRLTARTDRKRMILSHNLLEYRKNLAIEKKRTKDQRDLFHKSKPFARIMSHPDYQSFAEDLEKEQNLRQAITQLQDWRRMRLATLSQGEKYESDKANRHAKQASALGQLDRLANTIRSSKQTALLPETAPAVANLTTSPSLPIRLSAPPVVPPPEPPTPRASLAPVSTITPLPLQADSAPDLQLLLPAERDLCVKLRLQPKSYMAIKDAVFREAIKGEGKLKKKQVRELARVDTTKGGRVFEFMVEEGWLGNGARV